MVASACSAPRICLSDSRSFQPWLLGDVAGTIGQHGADGWYQAFRQRYLDLQRVAALCETET